MKNDLLLVLFLIITSPLIGQDIMANNDLLYANASNSSLDELDKTITSNVFDVSSARFENVEIRLNHVSKSSKWSVYSVKGRLIQKGNLDKRSKLNLVGIVPGSYLLQVESVEGDKEERILIIHDQSTD